MFTVQIGTETVLYTGDYNTTPDRHLSSAWIDCIHPDLMITESTYLSLLFFYLSLTKSYSIAGSSIYLGAGIYQGEIQADAKVNLPLKMMNRHGLVTGATGSGKTRTLQLLAEQLSTAGVFSRRATTVWRHPAPQNSDAPGRYYGFTASNEMLFTPNFLLAPRALSEMNW